jgi:hypothetical protein
MSAQLTEQQCELIEDLALAILNAGGNPHENLVAVVEKLRSEVFWAFKSLAEQAKAEAIAELRGAA